MEGDIITLFIIGVIVLFAGASLLLAIRLDGFAVALTAVGLAILLVVAVVVGGFILNMKMAYGRDLDGKFANSALKPWFNSLRSGKGPCCSDADGYTIMDSDWESRDGHYRVRIQNKAKPGDPFEWVDVPDEAVITEPNRAGRTMVWPIFGVPNATIRCFMPGPMT